MNTLINYDTQISNHNLDKTEVMKQFVINNLKAFKTKKLSNKKELKKLIKKLMTKDNSADIIMELEDLESNIPQKSFRLKTLLYVLRKHIENNPYYEKLGVSKLSPDENNLDINEYDILSIKHQFKISSVLDDADTNWTKDLAIVCVYGNIKSHGNIYGHTLLRLGNLGYLHVDNLLANPQFIPHFKFSEYLQKNKSFVIDVQILPNNLDTETVKNTVQKYSSQPWFWRITHHNCLSFAREVARECGVSHENLGGGHGRIKTPIDFFMKLDQEKNKINPDSKSMGFIKQSFSNSMDNVYTLATVAKQKFWKNIWRAEYARVNILPSESQPCSFKQLEELLVTEKTAINQDVFSDKQIEEIEDYAANISAIQAAG